MDHPIPVTFIRLIVVLPLAGAAINFIAGAWLQKTFGKRAMSFIGCGVVIAAFILAVRAFFAMIALPPENRFMLDDLWKWFDVGGLNLDIAFWLDPLSMVMTLIITGVGGLIHIYSTGYMHDDDGYWRFFGWLNLFTFAMLVLVLGDNMWLMFVGWEGVGLCSFALIGFWYKVPANTTAGNKAFIVNRVGDLAFVIALYSLFAGLQCGRASDAGDARGRAVRAAARGRADGFRRISVGASAGRIRHAADVHRGDGKIGADSAVRVAAGRDGGADAGQRADPCGDDGDGRRVHGRAAELSIFDVAVHDGRDRGGRRADCAVRGDDRHRAKRHQEGARVLDRRASSDTCSRRWASAHTRPACSI